MLLNCHTYFSYKFGTLSIDHLLEEAAKNRYTTLAVTDINSTSACIDFIRKCTQQNLKPLTGIDFRNGATPHYVGLARNNEGFRELNEHLSFHLHSGTHIPRRAPQFSHAFVIYPLSNAPSSLVLTENEFIGIRPSEINRLISPQLRSLRHKLVILQPVTFRHKRDFNVHRLLRTIDNNTLLSRLPKSEEAQPDEIMLPRDTLLDLFREYPDIISNTLALEDACSIDFNFNTSKNKRNFTSSPDNDFELLTQLCHQGLPYRYGTAPRNVLDRLDMELRVIRQMNFCSYFLINWDLVKYARNQGCYYVGRGSGANSLAAYLLRITDVDPIELDLYFERFINPSRNSPPDFDIDFASRDRDHMTRYLFDRYGWNHTALVGTYITFQFRSMIRELGKALGLPPLEIERLQSLREFNHLDDICRLVIQYSRLIHDFPSHLSVHSSGIVISEAPISTYTATILPPKGFPTLHFSMLEAEDMGFAKFDILGQRGLSKIEDAVHLVKENAGIPIDIHDIKRFKQDARVKDILKTGATVGCFYVESPAMRMLLTKLEADDYLRLVAASSIIRPGVAKSGMMREYILRYRDTKRREAARQETPELYELLAETYGVMVYQEDVLKVAHQYAGLTLAEADILRRGMSWKFKKRVEFSSIQNQFYSNCAQRNYPLSQVQQIWEQIESFANYAFSKGHSASYAVESYQALFLKAHFPLEYMVATINNGGGFYRTELYVHEARMHGARVLPPCINQSENTARILGTTIYLGLDQLKSLDQSTIQLLLTERFRGGCFKDLQNFLKRTQVTLEQVSILIRAGAFNFTGRPKKELLWNAHFLLSKSKKSMPERTLFEQRVKEFQIPELYHHPLEDAYDEIELLGFPVSCSPFEMLENRPLPTTLARDLSSHLGKPVEIVGYYIHVKHTRTSTKKMMSFGVFVDFEGRWIDTVQFPEVAARYPLRGPGCYLIRGKVIDEFGFISIETSEIHRLPVVNVDEPSTRLKIPEKYTANLMLTSRSLNPVVPPILKI